MILLLKLTVIVIMFAEMYRDGYERRVGLIPYWTKWLLFAGIGAMGTVIYYSHDIYTIIQLVLNVIPILIFKKPISDFSYNIGNRCGLFYVGIRNIFDKLYQKLFIFKIKGVQINFIPAAYLFQLFFGLTMNHDNVIDIYYWIVKIFM